jgi:hypothetical protein
VAALAGMIIGWARGGCLDALGRAPLRALPLLGVAVVMVALAAAAPLPQTAARALYGAGYVLALAVVWHNRSHPWALPVFIGLGLNAVVIGLNGGRMPVAPDALGRMARELGLAAAATGLDARHAIAGPGTRLAVLGDIVAVSVGRFGVIASPGDLLMALGIAGFVQGQMGGARAGPPRRASNV